MAPKVGCLSNPATEPVFCASLRHEKISLLFHEVRHKLKPWEPTSYNGLLGVSVKGLRDEVAELHLRIKKNLQAERKMTPEGLAIPKTVSGKPFTHCNRY